MATELSERMKLFKPGQLTWPDPELRQRCNVCKFAEEAKRGQITCGIVTARYKTKGVAFDGAAAIACPQFIFAGVRI